MKRVAYVMLAASLAACARKEPAASVPAPAAARPPFAVTSERVATTMAEGAAALEAFTPRVAAGDEGEGECGLRQTRQGGGRTLSAFFPRRDGAHTSVTIMENAEGRTVRFIENRGIPRPNASLDSVRAEARRIPSTTIQLDYVTGQALVVNSGGGEPGQGVRGSVAEFERSAVLGDLPARAAAVRRVCAGNR